MYGNPKLISDFRTSLKQRNLISHPKRLITQEGLPIWQSLLLVYLAMTYFSRSYAPSILGPGTKLSGGEFRHTATPDAFSGSVDRTGGTPADMLSTTLIKSISYIILRGSLKKTKFDFAS